MQIKLFDNGVKSILTPNGKGRKLLQVFDKENCMISQREIQSGTSLLRGSKELSKITLRQNKETAGMIESLKTYTEPNGAWASSRVLHYQGGDVFINNNITWRDGEKDAFYFKESISDNLDLKYLDFPLLKKANRTKTKYDELVETLDNMRKQWFNPQAKGQVKPMMPKNLEKHITDMQSNKSKNLRKN